MCALEKKYQNTFLDYFSLDESFYGKVITVSLMRINEIKSSCRSFIYICTLKRKQQFNVLCNYAKV